MCVCQNGAAVFAKANIRNVSQKCSEAEVLLHFFLCPKATFTSAFFGYLATVLRAINIINRIQ